MSVVAMPPYPSTIPASAFSPTANDDNVWMATARGRCGPQLEVAIVLLVDVIRVSRIRRRSADARHPPSRPNAYHG
jgi:hypothetical protein